DADRRQGVTHFLHFLVADKCLNLLHTLFTSRNGSNGQAVHAWLVLLSLYCWSVERAAGKLFGRREEKISVRLYRRRRGGETGGKEQEKRRRKV
ncbi:MAG: hypothetical protein ACYDG7_02510, partial [Thermoleophilia bacterium]